MNLIDAFTPSEQVQVKFSTFYSLMKEATKAELLVNAVVCKVPHQYIQEMMTGHTAWAEEES